MSSAHDNRTLDNQRQTQPHHLGLDDITIVDNSTLRKAVSAAALGNAMEWFDFGVFALVTTAIGANFFPGASPAVRIISTFSVFAAAFLARPLGGLVFGPLGDRIGRKQVLALTMIMMAISTFCIGLIPNYNSIGIAAPLLLLLFRLIQGFSAGGEYGGAATFVAEYSPDRKRGFMGSWLEFGTFAGFILASLTVAAVNYCLHHHFGEAAFDDWGWRIPFFIAGPLGLIGLFLRTRLEETPAFAEHAEKQKEGSSESVPLSELLTKHWKPMLLCIGLVLLMNVSTYLLTTVMPTYMQQRVTDPETQQHISQLMANNMMTVCMCGMLIFLPLLGFLADKVGRKPLIIAGCILLLLFSLPLLHIIQQGSLLYVGLGLLGFSFIQSFFSSTMPSKLPSLFATSVRYGGLAIAFNISAALFAGPTPMISEWIMAKLDAIQTPSLFWLREMSADVPAFYWMIAAVIGLITILLTRETAAQPLEGSAPAASSRAEAREILQEHRSNLESELEEIDEEIRVLNERRAEVIADHPHLHDDQH